MVLDPITAKECSNGSMSLDGKSLEKLIRAFHLVEKKDTRENRKGCKQCFFASDAVDLLVNMGYARSRSDAVFLGQVVQEQYGLFCHVSGEGLFEDGNQLYCLNEPGRVSKRSSWSERSASDTVVTRSTVSTEDSFNSRGSMKMLDLSKSMRMKELSKVVSRLRPRRSLSEAEISVCTSKDPIFSRGELSTIVKAFSLVDVRDRKHRLKSYKECFLGSEAVDSMVALNCAKSREDAVRIGRLMAAQYGLFGHVTGDREFDDGFYFYQFRKPSSSK